MNLEDKFCCGKYDKYDFSKIMPKENHSCQETKEFILEKLVTNGHLNTSLKRKIYVLSRNLEPLFESVLYHTRFLDADSDFVLRLACLVNGIVAYPQCLRCGNEVKRIKNRSNFRKMVFGKYCCTKCNGEINYPERNLDKSAWDKRNKKVSLSCLETRKNGLPQSICVKLKAAANRTDVKQKKARTNLIRYGVSNPGVLGAYFSKSGQAYIEDFLKKKNIEFDRCFFYNKGIGKREFFQIIFIPFLNKNRFVSYDLVVFKNVAAAQKKDVSQIELVLEYNGMWHYTAEEVLGHEEEPAVPYIKNNTYKFTKKEVYELDKAKLDLAKKWTDMVYIFSIKTNMLVEYDGRNL